MNGYDISQCVFFNQVERTWQRPMWTLLSFTILGRAWPETDFKDLQGSSRADSRAKLAHPKMLDPAFRRFRGFGWSSW